jgi:serine/threonine-protein kinase TTK/MPS1
MATASPTPLGSSHFANPSRRPASRQGFRAPATKLNPGRSTASSVAAVERSYGHERYAARAGEYSLNDSSDDELPAPMIFSALTKALLNDEGSILPPSSPAKRADTVSGSTAVDTAQRHATADAFANGGEAAQETTAPQEQTDPSPYPRRVVRLSGTPRSTIFKRSVSSVNGVRNAMEDTGAKVGSSPELNTPSHPIRTVRLSVTSTSRYGQSVGSSGRDSNGTNSVARRADDDTDMLDDPATVARTQLGIGHGSVTRYGAIGRGTWVAENGLQSSMRVKPLKKVAGSFLSGPARRGRRRQSEEDEARAQEIEDEAEPGSSSQEPDSQGSQVPNNASEQATKQSPAAYYSSYQGSFASGSPISLKPPISTQRSATTSYADKAELMLSIKETTPREPPSLVHPVFKIPGPPPDLPSANDQENEAPPTFKRNKPEVFTHFGKVEKVAIRPDRSALEPVASPQRQALAPRSQNTPRRPAPPPPKMSVLETVTATAGAAATSHASKKRNNVRVNGKVFTRMDLVGRGGSSKVWRVMAENGKVFALKRVSLEDADENAVRGYKGEIDLLKKLEGNDRVVRLLDYEMNEDKQTLSVVSSLLD